MRNTYDPDLYDIATPSTVRGDLDWYRRMARESGGPVLELGAGTGRITLPIAEDGISIHAIDSDSSMVNALRKKTATLAADARERITITQADMRTLDLGERFALVIAPFRVFLHNVSDDDRMACLTSVREHLRSDGQLAFNVFYPSLEYMGQNVGAFRGVWRWTATHELPDGGLLVSSEANHYDSVRQRLDSLRRYDQVTADGAVTRSHMHRTELAYLYPADIREMLQRAGFKLRHIWGGFDEREVTEDSDEIVVLAQR